MPMTKTDSVIGADPDWSISRDAVPSRKSDFTIYVVEDDVDARGAMIEVVGTMSLRAVGLDSAEAFLESYDGKPSIMVCDIRMPGMSGLELQKLLIDRGVFVPVVIVTGFPHVRHVVEAIKNGAVTVLEKPFTSDDLWLSLREAIATYDAGYTHHTSKQEAQRRYETLKPKEHLVLELILKSQTNKTIARQLDVSVRTVEARRRRILEKMNAESLVELVRLVDLAREDESAFLR